MKRPLLLALALAAAPPGGCKDAAPGATDTASATDTATTGGVSITLTEVAPTSSGSTGAGTSTGDATTGPAGPCVPLACDGAVLACGDCMDNDGDGKIDTADPECVSPCDKLEDTFATGLPGDNMDPCKQDCFFDGNSGGGAGDCAWNLACDPMGPGGDKCPYDPDQNNCPAEQSEACVSTCHVPKGCDCFGCCTVDVDGTAYDIYLGDPDCSLSAIDSCEQCTKNDDCDESCDPANCEVCFGMELPPGCDDPSCDGGMGCVVDDMGGSNCPLDMYCSTGCCVPLVTG